MSPKTYFSIEDVETVFKDAYDRGRYDARNINDFFPDTAEKSWIEYKQSNRTVFEANPSRPVTDSKPQTLKCPKCGGTMKARTGKYGNFWGCATYPKCDGTRDSLGRSKTERDAERNLEVDREPVKSDNSGFTFVKKSK